MRKKGVNNGINNVFIAINSKSNWSFLVAKAKKETRYITIALSI